MIAPSNAAEPLILVVDAGSSSTRVSLYDRTGHPVAGLMAQESTTFRTEPDGTAELDPDEAVERVARCIDRAVESAGSLAQKIGAVAIDTLVSNLMAVDDRGHALSALITYADTRNSDDAEALRRILDERDVHDRTGCMLRSSYWPARLVWLRRTLPDVWMGAARFITLGEYIEHRLFGRSRVSLSVASWSGLLDRRTLAWDGPLLETLDLTVDRLSPLVDRDEALTGLAEPYASRWPALRSIPWFPAIGDGAAANIGSGCTDHSRIAMTIGTSGALRVVQQDVSEVPAGLWAYRVDRRLALVGGATSEGGNVYGWLRDTLRMDNIEREELEFSLSTLPPDGHGLTVLPFFAGERSPGWAGAATATFHGLTLATTPLEIVKASLEAVAYRFALIEQALCRDACCSHRLIASGGGLQRSPAWAQIFADVLGRTVVMSAEPEATSRGTAVLALNALGILDSVQSAPAEDGTAFYPEPERHAIYQKAIARQQWLYDRLIAGR